MPLRISDEYKDASPVDPSTLCRADPAGDQEDRVSQSADADLATASRRVTDPPWRGDIGERFYIYAARPKTREEKDGVEALTSPRRVACGDPNPSPGGRGEQDLYAGVIVGTAIITGCERNNGQYQWHLSDVKRLKRPRKPKRMPQPVWFTPL